MGSVEIDSVVCDKFQFLKQSMYLSLTTKGKPLLCYKGFNFVIHRQSEQSIHWRCSQYNICKAKIKTNADKNIILSEQSVHSHEMETQNFAKDRKDLKDLIHSNPYAKPEQITLMALNNTNTSALPSSTKLKTMINNERRKHKLTEPKTIADINLETVYTNGKENFLLFDNKNNNSRVQVFGTIKDVERIMVADEVMCDGTFSIVPNHFTQLFTIMSKKYGKWFPSIYCLCQKKTQETYETIVKCLLDLCAENNIEINEELKVHVDFEKAIINAILFFLPSATIMHCLFHLGQSIFRKVQSLGLTVQYKSSEEFRINVRKLAALAFIEPQKVVTVFNDLKASNVSRELVKYFENTYVQGEIIRSTRTGKEVRSPALFPIEMWSCWNRVEEDLDRTNNVQESFHNSLRVAAGRAHIGYNEIVALLLKEHHKCEHNILTHINDGIPSPKKIKCKEKEMKQYADCTMNINTAT